jgi:hypothetical protein
VLIVRILDEPGTLGDVAPVMSRAAGINIDSAYVTTRAHIVLGVDDLPGAIQVAGGRAVMTRGGDDERMSAGSPEAAPGAIRERRGLHGARASPGFTITQARIAQAGGDLQRDDLAESRADRASHGAGHPRGEEPRRARCRDPGSLIER